MKTRLLKTIHYLAAALTVIVIALAFFVATLRAEAPVVAGETPAIETYLTQKLHRPVKIQSVSLKWRTMMPVLDIKNIEIFKSDLGSDINPQKLFAVHELSVGLRFIPSLWHREILLRYFFIDGLDLSLVQDQQSGKWQIKGLSDIDFADLLGSSGSSNTRKSLKLEGKNLSLNIDGIFPKTLFIKNFMARLVIENTPDGANILLNKINIENQDIRATGSITYLKDIIHLRLEYHLFSSITSRIDNYLPQNLLHPELIQWLTQSVKKLDSGDGVFILEGDLKDFPFTDHPGEFLVDTQLKNITLDYYPGWPVASNLDGELIFQGNNMQMHIASVDINHVKLEHVEAVIPHLGDESVLNIKAHISADSKDILDFVRHSPLKKSVGKYFEGYQWSGPSQLQLAISIPLAPHAKPNKTRVTGLLITQQNKLTLSPESTLENLKANIRFTEDGIAGENNKLNGILWGTPLEVLFSADKYLINYDKWRLALNHSDNRRNWKVDVFHPQLVGILNMQDGFPPKAISGKFRYLTIPAPDNKQSSSAFRQTIEPRKIPPLDIVINDFRYHDKNFGRVNFKTTPMKGGLKLNALQALMGGTVINMTGQWLQTSGRGKYSSIAGNFSSRSVSETLKNWGLSSSIQSPSATGSYALNWAGDLYSPDMKNLSGNIHFDVAKGQILNVGSQAQMDIGRLLTLLSFQSLAKRLRLDFSDLTTVGLNFDQLSGDFQLNHGIASTNNTLLDGPISSVLMTGSINMINQTYQLKLLVTPHLTSSLPIIATIAGGPVAGAATWVADKLFDRLLDKMTSDTYTVTGPWDKPVIK